MLGPGGAGWKGRERFCLYGSEKDLGTELDVSVGGFGQREEVAHISPRWHRGGVPTSSSQVWATVCIYFVCLHEIG